MSTTKKEVEEDAAAGCGVCMMNPATKEGCLGKYDYKFLCMPSMPWSKGGVNPPLFLGKDDKLGLFLALTMGLQHALAMVAGIATSGGALIAGDACFIWQRDQAMCATKPYLINAAWTTSGILTIIQVFRAKLCGSGYYLGTGLISVMGTSFTFLPIAREMVVGEILKNNGGCETIENPGMVGYGKFLGTCMVAALLEVVIAMLPPKLIKKLFPDVVCGATVMLIGGGLIGAGVKYLGGGVFCAENDLSKAPRFGGPQLCNENGEVALGYGAAEYVGLGFSVILASVLLQMFGSPFLKSTFLFWSLMVGCIISAIASYTAKPGDKVACSGATPTSFNGECMGQCAGPCIAGFANAVVGNSYSYWDSDAISGAPWFTFNWATTFPLGFAPEYLLPILIGFFVSSAETIGDIGMSCVASRVPAEGEDYNSRIQGGLLADGINSLIACLMTSPPNTTFSQNNGIIALTRCASRAAGFACAFWLILFGVIGKLGALFASIPICVVGGMVLQCFTMVFVSGMQMATSKRTRRNSFILMISLGLGLGVAMMPTLFEGGGGKGFYAGNLKFNIGFWPAKYTCDEFYTKRSYSPGVCTNSTGGTFTCDGGAMNTPDIRWPGFTIQPYREMMTKLWDKDFDDCRNTCEFMGGTFTGGEASAGAALGVDSFQGYLAADSCADLGGACCRCYNKGLRSLRTAVIMMLKTPYCIGFLAAVILNLLMPEDKADEFTGEVVKEVPQTESATA